MLPALTASMLFSFVMVELFTRLPFNRPRERMSHIIAKVLRIFRATSISDHWKEKVILHYAGQLAVLALQFACSLLAVAIGAATTAFALDLTLQPNPTTLQYVTTASGMAITTMTATVYWYVRMRLVKS